VPFHKAKRYLLEGVGSPGSLRVGTFQDNGLSGVMQIKGEKSGHYPVHRPIRLLVRKLFPPPAFSGSLFPWGGGKEKYAQYWVGRGGGEREWRGWFLASVVASFLFDFMVVSTSRW
jgi:hypothetical protein